MKIALYAAYPVGDGPLLYVRKILSGFTLHTAVPWSPLRIPGSTDS